MTVLVENRKNGDFRGKIMVLFTFFMEKLEFSEKEKGDFDGFAMSYKKSMMIFNIIILIWGF